MIELVLIDSSVWIEVGRNKGNEALKSEVTELLATGRAAMTEPIWTEIYRGVKGMREEELIHKWKQLCRWLAFEDGCWLVTALTARHCHKNGVNVPFGDILIYSCAKHHGTELLEVDKHFKMIRRVCDY